MIDRNPVEMDLIPQIRSRWSPYEFSNRPVEAWKIKTILDAARWSANSFNEQPWRYLLATRDQPQELAKLLSCLVESNQTWAKHLPVLMISLAKKTFSRNGKPNRVAVHDVGAAAAQMTMQAEALGLHIHQMAGIEISKIRQLYQVPDDFDPVAAIAVGYPGENPDLHEDYRKKNHAPRHRKPFDEFVFTGSFGKPSEIIK
ncbi:MAG: nitroreductase family protein [Phycisphaerales bacterium]|nr:nitroreductase family protein [Phycisphaerales bacterium]